MRLDRWFMGLVAAPALLLVLGACARITGVNDLKIVKSLDGGTTGADNSIQCSSADQTPCGQCIEQHCCGAALDCVNDPTCKNCLDHPTSCAPNALIDTYEDCATKSCAGACDR